VSGAVVKYAFPKPDGVRVIEHKSWNTKQVWANGCLQMTYRRQPKKIYFKSRMVNDENQDLCGGWHRRGHDGNRRDENAEVLHRVADGLKPLGIAHAVESEAEVERCSRDLSERGLDVKIEKHFWKGWNVVAAQKGTLRELFDLAALTRDYVHSGTLSEAYMAQSIRLYADRRLIDFAENYDWQDGKDVPLWVTGLILGYPVENTISLYFKHYGIYAP